MRRLVSIGVDVGGEHQLSRAFHAYDHEVDDLTEPLAEVGRMLVGEVVEQFASEGAHSGRRWTPLSPDYAVWKEAHYPGMPMLVRTGATLAELVGDGIKELGPHRLVYGAGRPAGWLQSGTEKMPARRIVDLNTGARRRIDRIFAAFLHRKRRDQFGGPR